MRNVFDQYSQPENKITHALMVALDKDRGLLKAFLKMVNVKSPVNAKQLRLDEQTIVGQLEEQQQESNPKGLPDGWIHNDDTWCLLIESKVASRLTKGQIDRHYQTAKRAGYEQIRVLSIEAVLNVMKEPDFLIRIQWQQVYQLLIKHRSTSVWAAMAAEYFEQAEAKFADSGYLKEGNLTVFSGINFSYDNPYTYAEAKRQIKLITEAIRSDTAFCKKVGIDPTIEGRGAITGSKGSAVWDYLTHSNAKTLTDFTHHPHFTIGINLQRLHVSVTIPNKTKTQYRNNLRQLGNDEFTVLIAQIVHQMKPLYSKDEGYRPWCTAVQRRYASQRAAPTHDAVIEFDLRTAIADETKTIKPQPQWLHAAYSTYCDKQSNYQLQIGANIDFAKSDIVKSEKALDQIKQTWLACTPLIDAMIL